MTEETVLRITTWNVLNEGYEDPSYYHQDSHPYLRWDSGRKQAYDEKAVKHLTVSRVLDYITKLDSDVFCLQEVNRNMATFITDALNIKQKKNTYDFIWRRRNQKGVEDGSATIYRKDLLHVVKSFMLHYENRTYIMLCTHFRCIQSKKEITVVNTHVNWTTRGMDIVFLMNEVKNNPDFPDCPRIAMGDFNAEDSEDWYKQLSDFSALDAYKAHHGELAQFSYNSGKNKKFIDFILLWGLVKENVDDIFLGVNQKNALDLSQIKTMPAKDLPSDHLPVTIHLKL